MGIYRDIQNTVSGSVFSLKGEGLRLTGLNPEPLGFKVQVSGLGV